MDVDKISDLIDSILKDRMKEHRLEGRLIQTAQLNNEEKTTMKEALIPIGGERATKTLAKIFPNLEYRALGSLIERTEKLSRFAFEKTLQDPIKDKEKMIYQMWKIDINFRKFCVTCRMIAPRELCTSPDQDRGIFFGTNTTTLGTRPAVSEEANSWRSYRKRSNWGIYALECPS